MSCASTSPISGRRSSDGWKSPPTPGVRYPRCTAGKNAAPPEDCGGPWGYAEMMQALGDPSHPERDDLLEWLDDDFDPTEFDRDELNAGLGMLKLQSGGSGVPLFWSDIRANAEAFAKEWSGASSERAEAQTFWNEFFAVFGVQRRRVAVYEKTRAMS